MNRPRFAARHGIPSRLGTYDRIKVLLKKRFDAPTICQVTGRAARTVAEYLVIVERFHPQLLESGHRDWMVARRKRRNEGLPVADGVHDRAARN